MEELFTRSEVLVLLGRWGLPPWVDHHGTLLGGDVDCAALSQEMMKSVDAVYEGGNKVKAESTQVTTKASYRGHEGEVDVTVTLNGDGTVDVSVVDEGRGIGGVTYNVSSMVREATETNPPLSWLNAKLHDNGFEHGGSSWRLAGTAADHAGILYELITRFGWWPETLQDEIEQGD